MTPEELDEQVERLHAEWLAARGGDPELSPETVDAIARAMIPPATPRGRRSGSDAGGPARVARR